MSKRKQQQIPPKPPGCSRCKGEPWIAVAWKTADGTPAMARCDCHSGAWFRARDNERLVKERELGLGRVRL